ncbi:MAG: ABC transporter ATP-binding protein [Bacilli bacterium]|nr:ABC transporter ATP-binding protein [Bacilli bacterium]
MPKLTIENLKVIYNNKKGQETIALDGFSYSFNEGSLHAIIGFSGCGKTTLLRAILGFVDYQGKILFDNVDAIDLTTQERNISYVSQQYILYPHLTIFDNIASPLKIAKAPKEEIKERVKAVAQYLGIEHCLTRKPRHLSGGQQQKVALARAIIKKSQLYLFDEPLSNFDKQGRSEVRLMIKKFIKENNVTALYVTHDFQEAMTIADNIVVINNGKVIASGSPKEIYESKNPIVNQLKCGVNDE